MTTRGIDLAAPDNIELVRLIFGAKRVPPALLGKIAGEREFHRSDWQSVISATKGDLRDFDYYFDFVIEQVKRLEPLWME